MTKEFYTSAYVYNSKILLRYVKNGVKGRRKVEYSPTLFIPSPKPTAYTTLYGEYVAPIKPGNIKDAKNFLKQYEGVDNYSIYGNQKYEYTFISDNYPGVVDWDIDAITIANIDIETSSEFQFGDPDTATEEITAITIKKNNQFVVFACGEFNNKHNNVTYTRCVDEYDLLKRFLDFWEADYPDIVTGWHIQFYDIPYIINRIAKLLGEEQALRISPWKNIYPREVPVGFNKKLKTYTIIGVATLDYLELYKKFAPNGKTQENYKLDTIANFELGANKISYEEYGTLHRLYKDNFQKFIEYNIRDVDLVGKLEDKLKLIELALTLAYDSKCNYEDVFFQVRMWDTIIYNHLKSKKIVLPPIVQHSKDSEYVGAYVKEPRVGLHEWPVGFDLTSMYPHLIMQYNLSPETLVEPKDYTDTHRNIISMPINIDNLLDQKLDLSDLVKINCTVTPFQQLFRRDKQGFLPEIMEKMFKDRDRYKNLMKEAKRKFEKETNLSKKNDLEKQIARYNNLQLAKKVSLNSAYGAMGNQFFRLFDVRIAASVTTAGQLSIRWIEKAINKYLNSLFQTTGEDYVIYSDTDSIYVCFDKLVKFTFKNKEVSKDTIVTFLDKVCDQKIQPFIDKSFEKLADYVNAYEQKMFMKREAICDKGIFVSKKRYILNVYDDEKVRYSKPKHKIMGLEMVKSSTPVACKAKMKEAVDILINQDNNAFITFLENFREEFKKLPLADIASPRGVNGLGKYASKSDIFAEKTPMHTRGALLYNHYLQEYHLIAKYPLIQEGEKIKYVYLKEPNPIQSNTISFPQVLPPEFGLDKYIDYYTQFEKTFVEPMKIILDAMGWQVEHKGTLEKFLG